MNRDELIALARKAGAFPEASATPEKDVQFLRRFAALVAAHEREECAKVCDAIAGKWLDRAREHETRRDIDPERATTGAMAATFIREAIRARGTA
jgi:hypothetical protein